jgi:hypothetical protein
MPLTILYNHPKTKIEIDKDSPSQTVQSFTMLGRRNKTDLDAHSNISINHASHDLFLWVASCGILAFKILISIRKGTYYSKNYKGKKDRIVP